MKILIILAITTFLLSSCKEDNLTDNSDGTTQTEYTIEELENDPNWVEFTDFRVVDSPCIYSDVYEYGKLVNTKEQFIELGSEPGSNINCPYIIFEYEFNFKDSTLLLFYSMIGGGFPKTERKMFYNQSKDKYVYLLKYGPRTGTEELRHWIESLAIPKLSNSSTFVFDTTLTWEYLENQ